MKKFLAISALVLGVSLFATSPAQALIANDVASNPAYSGGWGNGTNGGSGFLPWAITGNGNGTTLFTGNFTGNSAAGAGNINTGGVSFGLYANPVGAAINANRAFATSLVSLDVFTFRLALNYDNGNKGFDFFAGGDGTVLNFNVGGGAGVSSTKTLTPITSVVYDYGGNDAVFDVTLSMTSASSFSYDISRTSSQGLQGTLFSGNVSGLTQGPTGFGFYVSGTDAGGADQNNLYLNSLTVVPEPSALVLLGLGTIALGFRSLKNRRKGVSPKAVR